MDLTDTIIPRSDQMETWRPVVGYEGMYEVSDAGRVRSLSRINRDGHRRRGRIMRLTSLRRTPNRAYLVVTLWRDNQQRVWLVHRLVLLAFSGPQPIGMEALHRDGDPTNNNLANLTWGTHSENQYDQVAHGTHVHAGRTHCPSGHPYDDANTYIYPGRPHRGCRACRRQHARNLRARRVAAA